MKKLGFGFMRLPLLNKESDVVDLELVKKMVSLFMKRGFTYFDTAYVYHNGKSESLLKQALVDNYPRDSFTVATKLAIFEPRIDKKRQEEMFDEQRTRLGVDYIDYYLLHALSRERMEIVDRLESFDFIKQKKLEGKIRNIGFSFHDKPEALDYILNKHPEVDFVQLQINYLDWENPLVESRACYEIAKKYHKPVIVMEPVKGGTLVNLPLEAEKILKQASNLSVASWAIRYAASLDNVFMVLSGMSTLEQVEDNTSYMEEFKPLNEKEKDILSSIVPIIDNSIAIPCTACGYCLKGCPMNIPIPQLFSLYNKEKIFPSQIKDAKNNYLKITSNQFLASSCLKCGACEKSCPQHLKIRDYLEKIADTFEN